MGELRLYAIAIDEARGLVGARGHDADALRAAASRAFAPPAANRPPAGLISKLGPLFRRVPGTRLIGATDPQPRDLEVLLSGEHVPPDRAGATWRVFEALVRFRSWGATTMPLPAHTLDALDFALSRGGAPAAVSLRHLISRSTEINLLPVAGFIVGWHPYAVAREMAQAYRAALPELTADQQAVAGALIEWLGQFESWAAQAHRQRRPAPDLVGFWAE